MTAAAIHPASLRSRGIVKRFMIAVLETKSIIAIIIGTAMMPLITALQNNILIGSSGVKSMSTPIIVARMMTL